MEAVKNLSIKAIEKAITEHSSDHFVINQNYEIVIPESGKSLLSPDYHDISVMRSLFNGIYEKKSRFVSNDVEVDSFVFVRRLNALSTFLKKIGEDAKPVARIITNVRGIEGDLKIESITCRIFDDLRNPVCSKVLIQPGVKNLLHKFCQQWEVEKQELLYFVSEMS